MAEASSSGTSSAEDTSLAVVAHLVRLHLPARDLVRVQLVSKEWRVWCSQNIALLSKVRRENQSTDWYFPTVLKVVGKSNLNTLIWSGLHHLSEEEHRLPDLDFIPNWKGSRDDVLASSNGLLFLRQSFSLNQISSEKYIVCNPLTKEWKVLPVQMGFAMSEWTRRLVNTHLVVDDLTNSYNAMMISTNFISIYNSRSSRWISSALNEPASRGYLFGSTCANGLVYILEHVVKQHVVVRVCLIETGRWLPGIIYTLYDPIKHYCHFGQTKTFTPSLVACMGEVYAIIPAAEDLHNVINGVEKFPFRSLVSFHVFKLQEMNKTFASCSKSPLQAWFYWSRSRYIRRRSSIKNLSCNAKANMIWLAFGDHLLRYDVFTGSWIDKRQDCAESLQLSYEPNFHVKP